MQNNSSRVFLHFVLMFVAALACADAGQEELRGGTASLIISQSSIGSYLGAHALCSFISGFLLIATTLGLLQLVALLMFPLQGTFEGAFGTPLYVDVIPSSYAFHELWATQPFIYNGIYLIWTAVWGGFSALLSCGLSLLFKRSRAIGLVSPTLLFVVAYQLFPLLLSGGTQYLFYRLSYPSYNVSTAEIPLMMAYPLVLAILSLVCFILVAGKRRDICI
ncbi:hypothetical protein KPC83_00165 [Collinsella sp. zg1085]|uniref:hypothetical protein n=1 Tax=Collinsella sp. zg1085 TaxID=2844380 RepID=UPI001C0ACBD4|nr:hypothetical protein [Collinsella sp. zg1085]QWT17628.1 hypothetical protein KPC83_00165 [Collinsella sp. zg1085]